MPKEFIVETHNMGRTELFDKSIELIEQGKWHAAFEVALKRLCPNKSTIDLASERIKVVSWDDWDDEAMGNPMDQELVNQALNLIDLQDKAKAVTWLKTMLAPQQKATEAELQNNGVSMNTQEPDLKDMTAEACRQLLTEKWIVVNNEIPEEVKIWVLKLLVKMTSIFSDNTITDITVTYSLDNRNTPTVNISYTTKKGKHSFSLRESFLK